MGVPCCITTEPGGEGPPEWKKTWDRGPDDMQGLALAIPHYTHTHTHALPPSESRTVRMWTR